MGMSGLLSGYIVVKAFSGRSQGGDSLDVSTPSWDLGIVVSADGGQSILAFPTLFAPGMNDFRVAMYITDTNNYTLRIIFDSVSTSSIVISANVIVAFILFSAQN